MAQLNKASFWAVVAVAGLSMLASRAAVAAIVSGGASPNPPANDTAPINDPGWNRVGATGVGGGVYLGNGWALTAYHVGKPIHYTLSIPGDKSYSQPATPNRVRLTDPNDASQDTDLVLFKIDVNPGDGLYGLPVLPLASSSPSPGDVGTMIGMGVVENGDGEQTWYVDTDPDPWDWSKSSFGAADGTINGFEYGPNEGKNWAFTQVHSNNVSFDMGAANGEVEGFSTVFVDENEYGIAVAYDSGTPMFLENNGQWELLGLAHTISQYSGQPDSLDEPNALVGWDGATTAMYGNLALYSDLSQYADQITQVIPEPASAALLLLATPWLVRRPR